MERVRSAARQTTTGDPSCPQHLERLFEETCIRATAFNVPLGPGLSESKNVAPNFMSVEGTRRWLVQEQQGPTPNETYAFA
ncbi:hypothetical protein AMECASPLE_003759 [Ameca splendens]|uniref:Uncharacterized protein n=1 Tax=Ameca splendens TaxID=208324 RepID=A0ABV0YKR9_9TELE